MTVLPVAQERASRARNSSAVFVCLAFLHGAALVVFPSLLLVALGLWWNANTISHNFIHRPFFRTRWDNKLFSIWLSLLLGFPQTLWHQRHMAHHAGVARRLDLGQQVVVEFLVVLLLWGTMGVFVPSFLLTVYLPGFLVGHALCALHGYYEHAAGTASNYGRLYNLLFFNDGYHVEHHAHPGAHWRDLPRLKHQTTRSSRWPAVLRWLDVIWLNWLERSVLLSRLLQRFVLRAHQRAFRKLLPELASVKRVGIVGGGLFPRTALVLERLLPSARLVIIDGSKRNLKRARGFLDARVEYCHAWYDPLRHRGFDLVVIPLAYQGARAAIYSAPPAPCVVVHDWIWNRRGVSAVISLFLLKRLNLVRRPVERRSVQPGGETALARVPYSERHSHDARTP